MRVFLFRQPDLGNLCICIFEELPMSACGFANWITRKNERRLALSMTCMTTIDENETMQARLRVGQAIEYFDAISRSLARCTIPHKH